LERGAGLVAALGHMERLDSGTDPSRPVGAAVDVSEGIEVLLDLDGLIDRDAQRADLQRNLDKLDKQAAGVRGKLGNEQFVAKAPADLVQRERARLADLESERQRLAGLLAALGD
jgi:valyl-tRNA synthetase